MSTAASSQYDESREPTEKEREATEAISDSFIEPSRRSNLEARIESLGHGTVEIGERTLPHPHPRLERIIAFIFGTYRWQVETSSGKVIARGRARTLSGVSRKVQAASAQHGVNERMREYMRGE